MAKFGSSTYLLTGALAIVLPSSIVFWLGYYISPFRSHDSELSPLRCFLSVLVPSALLYNAVKNKKLDLIAMIVAYIMGFVETLSNLCMVATTIAFFLAGTRATRFRNSQKLYDKSDKNDGRRNWIQVLSNGGVGMQIAILMLIEKGPANEIFIDFSKDYFSSCLSLAFLGSIACACGDTLASELAPAVSYSKPRLIINPLRSVPCGTNGGVTFMGFICSAAGGLLCGSTYYILTLICASNSFRANSPPQWPLILVGLIAGLLGSIIDSIIGATLQYSGFDTQNNIIVSKSKPGVVRISGAEILDNHSVNLLSTLFTALVTPYIGELIWESHLI